ncbi:MAG: HIT domain-containing protein [Candidatus Omnitrophota bacterium]
MKRLWAPWRMAYITDKKTKGCLFCRIRRSRQDRKNFVFLRTQHSLAVLNLYPYNNGHLMVAPLRHVRSLSLLPEPELLDLMRCLKKCQVLLTRILKPQGFNIGVNEGTMAGAGIEDHLHIHLVPRWRGDVNFMPVVASTKIISQSLESLYGELKKSCR